MNEPQNMDEIIDGLVRPVRMAHAICQSPKYIRDEIADLVEGAQIPGSFGDLVKQSVEMRKEHKEFKATNIASIFRHA
jgi:hypothetical protein